MKRPALACCLAALALAAWLGLGCTGPIVGTLVPNQRPTVRFTLAPISADPDDPVFYAYRVFWAGEDPDGRVDHFDYAIDPGPRDTAWVSTPHTEEVLFFRSTTPDGKDGPLPLAHDYHVLVIRAVDNEGAMSARKTRAFYSYTVAPSVEVVAPHPNRFIEEKVPPTLTVHWQGVDPDGQVDTHPVRYRFRLLPFAPGSDGWMLIDPDSLLRRERDAGFAGWDSTSGDTTSARFTNLTPGSHYMFLVLALDEAGALTPTLSLDENMLQVAVDLAATLGPVIHVFNSYLDYTFPSGGYTTDELLWVRIQAPADRPITFNWDATASAGASIERYRWGVDLASVADETPRSDEVHDYFHWSRGGALEQSCTLIGLPPGQHLLYIEAKDNNGFASLGIVAFKLVTASLNQDLLIVDDTRRELDKFASRDSLNPYTDFWPSTTELDTFLYARGNVPWRATRMRGSTSVPGLFAGYAFDTLGTRISTPASAVTLETLAKYRHIVWIVDYRSASIDPNTTGLFGVTALRLMSGRGQASSLAAYVQAGGRVWLMGGGAGTVTIDAFNDARNDHDGRHVYNVALVAPGSMDRRRGALAQLPEAPGGDAATGPGRRPAPAHARGLPVGVLLPAGPQVRVPDGPERGHRGRGPERHRGPHRIDAGHAARGVFVPVGPFAGADHDLVPRRRGEQVRVHGLRAVAVPPRGRHRAHRLRAPGPVGAKARAGGPRPGVGRACAGPPCGHPRGGSPRNPVGAPWVPVTTYGKEPRDEPACRR